MSNEVSLDSKERSSWDFFHEKFSTIKERTYELGNQFIEFTCPRDIVTGSRTFHITPFTLEKNVGAAVFPSYKMKDGPVSQKYKRYKEVVEKIGQQLAQHSPRKDIEFEFTVINDWHLSSWCLPGGKIGLSLGLLNALDTEKRDFGLPKLSFEEKVAAVLSHAIIHASARHLGLLMEAKIYLATLIKVAKYVPAFFIDLYYNHFSKGKETDKINTQKMLKEAFDAATLLVVAGLGTCGTWTHELEADKCGMALIHNAGKSPGDTGLTHASAQAALWLQHFYSTTEQNKKGGLLDWIYHLTSTQPSCHVRLDANQKSWDELQIQKITS